MSTDLDDIVAVGGILEAEPLLASYRRGVFPWPGDGFPLLWYCPRARAVLEFENLHIGRSLARARRRTEFVFTIDRAFAAVIETCAAIPRADQDGTWITDEMISAYLEMHRLGHAHSVEAWRGDELVGGLYGIDPGGIFCGESMFHHEPYASHLALLHLVEHLQARGLGWMDIQVMTPHMEHLGAREIGREEFLERLGVELDHGRELFSDPAPG